jgi:signal transduction histidine kinase
MVDGDETRLAQVLTNLLDNAVKFTERGGRIEVGLSREAGGRRAVLRVADTGVGIEAALLRTLFEPFRQADRSLERTKGGLGLGLALVKGLAELHGGEAEARSDGPGHGAELVVRLPLFSPGG